jgi:hypothetical protein
MKRSLSAAVASLLIVIAGWLTQDCSASDLECHLSNFYKFAEALSDVINATQYFQ